MKVILFGATGMVGQGVLRECLASPHVEKVLAVGRTPLSQKDPKLEEVIHTDFFEFSSLQEKFAEYDACYFCLGVTSFRKSEADYRRMTYDITIAAAEVMPREKMTFCYVSGAGSDVTQKSRMMWARVKGETEQKLREMGFKSVYCFRPGYIQPLKGIRSKTALYQLGLSVAAPLFPLWKNLAPNLASSTETVGLAMIEVARNQPDLPFLENKEINQLAQESRS